MFKCKATNTSKVRIFPAKERRAKEGPRKKERNGMYERGACPGKWIPPKVTSADRYRTQKPFEFGMARKSEAITIKSNPRAPDTNTVNVPEYSPRVSLGSSSHQISREEMTVPSIRMSATPLHQRV